MSEFQIKVGDRLPIISATLKDATGAAANLTGASVRFHMVPVGDTTPKVDAAATAVDATTGRVSYSWALADTDTAGVYEGEWQVTFSDGKVQTFPNDSNFLIRIGKDLA